MDNLNVHRFRYNISAFETLTYNGGILPNLKKNPFKAILIPFFFVGQLLATHKLLKKYNIDLVHAHWIIPQGISAALIKKSCHRKVKLLITSHGGDLFSLNSTLLTTIKKWAIKHSDHMTVVSNAMKDAAIALSINNKKLSVASMGVDLQKTFTPPNDNSEREGIIFVGRLVEKKGVRYLLEAFKLVIIEHPNEHLTIIGDGPQKQALQDLSNNSGLSKNVTFTGPIENHLIPDKLRRAKLAVIPSIITSSGDQEGLGLSIIEALGCECPVIASDLPAIADIITHYSTGLLSKERDKHSLTKNIFSLINDTDLRKKLARQGRQHVLMNFDWAISAAKYHKIYSSLQ